MGPRSRVSGVGSGSLGEGAVFWGGIHVKTHPVIKCGDWGESTVENRLT